MPRFDTPLHTDDQGLERVLSAGMPVALVVTDGPGLNASLEESLRQVAKDEAGRLLVARMDARDNPKSAAGLGSALPALIAYRDGQEVARAEPINSQTFREHVAYLLGRGPRPAGRPTPPPRPEPASAPPQAAREPAVKPITVSDESFQRDVLSSELPVLVDLWAPWCGPCRMIAPVVEKLAREYAGRLKVAKLNVDENPRTAGMYQVQGIPTLLIFRNGQVIDRVVGAAPEPMLRQHVEAALK
jgi:thioredoxin